MMRHLPCVCNIAQKMCQKNQVGEMKTSDEGVLDE